MRDWNQHTCATIRACIFELLENGCDLLHANDAELRRLVREHLDYLQSMLGYDAASAELIRLIKSQRRALAGSMEPHRNGLLNGALVS